MSESCACAPCHAPRASTLTRPPARAVLARLESFLPELRASNQALEQSKPEQLDIEVLTDPEAPHIEMARAAFAPLAGACSHTRATATEPGVWCARG